MKHELKVIAHIRTDFPEKFGVPRQSGLIPSLTGKVVFEPEYRNEDMLRGLEGYDYIWLLWGFDDVGDGPWKPTVRPPRLGGNKKMGVFATRSPYRPNPIGLSSVKLEGTRHTADGAVLSVSGVDMRDGTPIYDIKPYIPYADCHPGVRAGFADETKYRELKVNFPEELLNKIAPGKREALTEVLRQDPRPHYQDDPDRIYGLSFAGHDVKFRVDGDEATVVDIC
ncbi:MAG: tRNA (N6-threonylcarbamoyladenosine(37)-N6)-methyltransferase TrmO [Clostridiales bacterium]|nr:tRNA (N6-threonylcarbamoyladenosine(37)-N6)-methyltransferase TrmO [Clostridiales bacterium]